MTKPLSSQIQNNGHQLVQYKGKWTLATKGIDGKLRVYDDNLGKFVEVDPNDLFGVNKKFEEEQAAMQQSLDAGFESQLESSNKWAKYYQSMLDKYNEMLAQATEALNNARRAWNIASNEHDVAEMHYNDIVSDSTSGKVEDLSADEQREAAVYKEQMDAADATMTTESQNKSSARSGQIKSEAFVIGYAHDLVSESLHQGEIQNQQALAQHIMGLC